MNIFKSLKEGLSKTRQGVLGKISELFTGKKALSASEYGELEELLLLADVGPQAAEKLLESVKNGDQELTAIERLKREMLAILSQNSETCPEHGGFAKHANGFRIQNSEFLYKPQVWLIAGVNGSGKTTTIGKLGNLLAANGSKVMLAAADTYRAAAIEQLELWSKKIGAGFVGSAPGADPASVAFDAVSAAQAQNADVLLIDTAGRLHTQKHLRDELVKVHNTIAKKMPGAPHQTLLVLDATTGQNALSQARLFSEAIPVSGIVLTKLDGTAKGGIVLAIAQELKVPVVLAGVGEGVGDLKVFDAEEFVEGVLG
ncbi:MAG: signal recognition particle-docking protein FtsY [bacterium]|nr:signal recognition particle-docking protein FtsY [bacterium]